MFRRMCIVVTIILLLALAGSPVAAHQPVADQQPATHSGWDSLWKWFTGLLGYPGSLPSPEGNPDFKSENDSGSFIDPNGFAAENESGSYIDPNGFTADEDSGSMMDPDG